MNGGKESERGDGEVQTAPAQVPIGWKRKVDPTGVVYISPSGSVLSCLEQVKSYLLTDGTCKCGLECPLILPKVFNFDPGAAVKQRTAEDVKADEDVTKLCIHKRKLIAVATLHKSMELPHPSLTLTSPGGGTSATSVAPSRSATPRAIRTKPHDGLPNSTLSDCKNPFKMMMAAGQRHYTAELSGAQQQELYSGFQRQRLGSSEPGPRSPYRSGHGGMLSPASSGSQVYGDGSLSPRTDPLGSPDAFSRSNPCGFPGAGSPSPIHGNSRIALSPPGIVIHGSPATQSSCAMAGRTNTPLSPTANKSPVMKKPQCNVNYPPGMDMTRAVFHHKPQSAPHSAPPPTIPPSCTMQKKQMTSEKDPLGILDPIPSKPLSQGPMANPGSANFQPNAHSQVPMMNVNIPPAIVPLPSNLPLPTVKPGPISHGGHMQRTQQAATSISPSPVTSPVHMAGPGLARMEASPQRSRSSSTSSEHGSFAMPGGHQTACGSIKVPPRSPRSSMGSPRPSMPSSPSAKPDSLHQYKDIPNQLLAGMGNTISSQHNTMFAPASSSNAQQKNHPGLLGMPLNQILNQHNAASFPASSLLSAAAKAQLANQNKLVVTSNMGTSGTGMGGGAGGVVSGSTGMGNVGGGSSGSIHPSTLGGGSGGGGSGRGVDGHSSLNQMLPPNSTMLIPMSEGQSGRAALRDKLMAQQRDPLRKRKQPSNTNHDNMVFNMLKPDMGGPRPPCPPEQMRKAPRLGGLAPNTSMAQLLQSMSNQSSHMAQNSRPACTGPMPPGPGQMHFGEGGVPSNHAQQSLQVQQRLHGPVDPMHCPTMEMAGPQGPQNQYSGMMNQMQTASMGNCGPIGQSGQVPLGNPSIGHPTTHPQQLAHLHQQPQSHPQGHGRPNMSCMVPNSNDGSCTQVMSEPGDVSSLNCSMGNPQMGGLMGSSGHMYQQHGQQPQQLHPGLQGIHRVSPYQGQGQPYQENPFPGNPSNSMACLYQEYQGRMQENVPVSHTQMNAQAAMTSLPVESGMFQEGQHELQSQSEVTGCQGSGERLPGGGAEAVDAIYRAVVDAASKGMHVVITTTVSGTTQASPVPALSAMSAFTASIGEPVSLPHAVNAVIHGQRGPEPDALPQPRAHQPRAVRPRRNSEQGKAMPDSTEAHEYFRPPGAGTPRGQWEGDGAGHTQWKGEEFLECSTQVRSSPAPPCPAETPHEHGDKALPEDGFRANHCSRTPVNFKERLEQTVERCTHVNGGLPGRGYADTLTGDDQSPSSSTSLEGAVLKEYSHFNGHYNGCAPSPSDTKSLSSEEELRHPDSPSTELLHYRSRTFHMGELVWGPIKGFPPWPAKLAGEEHVHSATVHLSEQAKVEPEKLKTLTQDLEALDRATKRNRKAGMLNNHLEAAIHEAMSELDKMSGTVHQIPSRDRQMKLPKPKRRKISR
ncbi:methyl-CpG-binding domain protein 5 [Chanos chanos]|uniref:Methyl-CpG-binding domain protein 5 n=1 Tax=Chanos chanos TaxID=29144 RepID=A0A6J2V5T1_CHACN|nr:methyl-CpG-binding domain protein 5 [Chanos chanos]